MQGKRMRIAAIFAALMLLLSLTLVMFAGCGPKKGEEGKNPGQSGEPTKAAKFVKDDSLKDKLLAMYVFEDASPENGTPLPAYDPYTGAAIPSAAGKYETNQNVSSLETVSLSGLTQNDYELDTDSTRAYNVKGTLSFDSALSSLYKKDGDGDPVVTNGVSFSFWAYNYEKDTTISSETAGTLAIDYANIVNNGDLAITWGNLNDGGTVKYPDQDTTVGRAAYTDKYITGSDTEGSYYEAQAKASAEDLVRFDSAWAQKVGGKTYDFTGWNVISGNVQNASKGSTVEVISEYCYQTWRYITVSLTEEGVSFYMNGRLAYFYPAQTYLAADPGWNDVSDPGNSTSHLYRYIWGLVGGEVSHPVRPDLKQDINTDLGIICDMFGADAKAYVDDLIIGYGLTAAEAQALYEDLSGKTYTAADIAVGSSLTPEQLGEQEAIETYLKERKEQYETAVEDASSSFTATKRTGMLATAGSGALAQIVSGSYEQIGNTALTNGTTGGTKYYVPTQIDAEDGSFEMTVTALQFSGMSDSGTDHWNGIYPMVYELEGTAWSKVAGFQSGGAATTFGSGSDEAWNSGLICVTDPNHEDFTAATSSDIVFDAEDGALYFNEFSKYCWITITLEYDGEQLSISWSYYVYYLGEKAELTNTETQAKFDYTIGAHTETYLGSMGYTFRTKDDVAIDTLLDPENLALKFGSEKSYVVITDLENCEVYTAA